MQPKKRFGQNFITDKKLLQDLVNLIKISSEDNILEIGPGKGDFTENIIHLCNSYFGIEIDKDLMNFLKKKFPKNLNSFINSDILKFDPDFIFSKCDFRLVGNIPYNISSPLLYWCENYNDKILDMHFMLQKEFALRCAGNEKTSSYGRLSVICKYLYEIEIIKEVSRDYFSPKPKVESLFVKFTPKRKKLDNEELTILKKVTGILFNKKRKKISNSLKEIMNEKEMTKLDLNLNLRPDELSLEQYLLIVKAIK
tara:strand:- start:2917 stop:3678 length:762 start_codon:yes stop_codon:yes gene_type:complete